MRFKVPPLGLTGIPVVWVFSYLAVGGTCDETHVGPLPYLKVVQGHSQGAQGAIPPTNLALVTIEFEEPVM